MRRILQTYGANHVRPHLALAKDAPLVRRVQRSVRSLEDRSSAGFTTNTIGHRHPPLGQSSADEVFGKDSARALNHRPPTVPAHC